jgi:tetratricopeptide (TPR) repeat protein
MRTCAEFGLFGVALAVVLALAPVSSGQQGSGGGQQPQQDQSAKPATPALPTTNEATKMQPEAPKVDPVEEAAYKTFFDTKQGDVDAEIPLGQQFLQKYPKSKYAGPVYSRLVRAYFLKQDWEGFYASADKAVSLNPNDVTTLVLVGWVIPHSYDPKDLEADSKIAKAENYEKHAIELLPTLQKPPGMTDAQFAELKASAESQAHSGLGLVYFRQKEYVDSIAELQKATAAGTPDPTDLWVMGNELQQLKRFSEAVDVFQKCGAIESPLQDRCKQFSEQAKKWAAGQPAQPTPPKP